MSDLRAICESARKTIATYLSTTSDGSKYSGKIPTVDMIIKKAQNMSNYSSEKALKVAIVENILKDLDIPEKDKIKIKKILG